MCSAAVGVSLIEGALPADACGGASGRGGVCGGGSRGEPADGGGGGGACSVRGGGGGGGVWFGLAWPSPGRVHLPLALYSRSRTSYAALPRMKSSAVPPRSGCDALALARKAA